MPTMVETIRDLCKKKNIAISRLEKDLNYGNGYLNPKKATNVDSTRLKEIANYLDVPIELLYGTQKQEPTTVADDELSDDQRLLIEKLRAMSPEELEKKLPAIRVILEL